jgi:hypothetical protein
MSDARRLPVGIPLEAPPGWKQRSSSPWRNVLIAATVTTLALLCLSVGWISVDPGSGRPPRSLPTLASLFPARTTPEPDPEPTTDEPSKPPEKKAVEQPKTPPPEKKLPEKKAPEKKAPEKKSPEKPPEKTPPTELKPTPPSVTALSFKKDVAPILEKACVRCHNANRQQGGVNVSTFEEVSKHVMAGKPDASDLLNVIVNGQMPPSAPMAVSEAERKKLRDWITQGAKP